MVIAILVCVLVSVWGLAAADQQCGADGSGCGSGLLQAKTVSSVRSTLMVEPKFLADLNTSQLESILLSMMSSADPPVNSREIDAISNSTKQIKDALLREQKIANDTLIENNNSYKCTREHSTRYESLVKENQTRIAANLTHWTCRTTNETEAKTKSDECEKRRKRLNKTRTDLCTTYKQHSEQREMQCRLNAEGVDYKQDYTTWVQAIGDWAAEDKQLLQKRDTNCKDATTADEACAANCTKLKRLYDSARKNCTIRQKELDQATCDFVVNHGRDCDLHAECHNQFVEGFNAVHEQLKKQTEVFKDEWQTLGRMRCIIQAIRELIKQKNATKAISLLEECNEEVKKLDLTVLNLINITLPKEPSNCTMLPKPCDEDYTEDMNGSLPDTAKAAACGPCTSTTSASTNRASA